ncbi:MAG: NAD(P)H-dependent oxidoreductase [Eubacteriales bacterium]|nr:NAD(P)H-dependent oxidoreductase [Eubacteriales bacterium]
MKITIINGSPKGDYSVTLHSCLYIKKHFPEHSYEVLNVGRDIKKFEKDFSSARESLESADLLIFSYPVYTFIAPSQLHRFIRLMKESDVSLNGKFATQITTSKHFYDITAHRYVEDNAYDMGLKVIKGLSADMDDLTTKKGREDVKAFFKYVTYCMGNDLYETRKTKLTAPAHKTVTTEADEVAKKNGTVSLVADMAADDGQLRAMTERFIKRCPYNVELINIHDFPFKGGCISCFNCSTDGTCIYKDGFQELLRDKIQKGSAIVIAFSIKDHSMGPVFKTYDDRQFCNGHRTVTMGMPFGYIVSGNLSEEENLRMIIDGRAEVGGNFLCGVATDELDPDAEIDALANKLSYAIENKYVQPSNFLGVGGMKIFRDLIWLMQGMMKADHRFYKSHGQYDFPQKKRGTMLFMYLAGAVMGNKKLKAKMGNKLNEGMIMPYKKALED